MNLAFVPAASARELLDRQETTRRFCESLAEVSGVTVSLLSRFDRDEEITFGQVRGFFRHDSAGSPTPRFWHIPTGLLNLLSELEPDVVHFNGFVFPVQTAEVAARLRPGSVLVLQHHGETLPVGLRRFRQRLGTRLASGVFFTSKEMAAPWIEAGMLGAGARVFDVLEASSDFGRRDRDEARAETGLTGRPAILWVGRLTHRKDPETAVLGFERAVEELPDARLHMVFQDDTLLPWIEARIAASPVLAGRVEIIGRVDHARLPLYYSGADLFLTSSPEEGSNYALIESVACGLLPVASNIPAHRAVTENGRWAFLFPVRDSGACGEAILRAWDRLCREPGLPRGLRGHFEKNLSWPSVARAAVRAYRELLDKTPRGDP